MKKAEMLFDLLDNIHEDETILDICEKFSENIIEGEDFIEEFGKKSYFIRRLYILSDYSVLGVIIDKRLDTITEIWTVFDKLSEKEDEKCEN